MWLQKAKGGSGIGPHWWDQDGDAVEVADELGRQILAIPGHDFTKLDGPPKPAPKAAPKAAAPEAAKPAPPAASGK